MLVLAWIICGIAAAYVAGQKNKSAGLWLLLGIVLGPIALLMVGFAPAAPAMNAGHSQTMPSSHVRTCPYCAEEIKWEAIVCKHCGRELGTAQPPVTEPWISKCHRSMLRENPGMTQGEAKLELSLQGFHPNEIADYLDSLGRP